MWHKKYKRIDGLWHEKVVRYYKDNGHMHDDIEWCVMEKVHGANFGIYLNQDSMLFAKRSKFLIDGENFFQCNRMIEREAFKCQQIWDDYVSMTQNPLEYMIVYGELFGGYYPHDDVTNFSQIRKIQKGVWYHPDINFYAFDIYIKVEGQDGAFLNYDDAIKLFTKNKLFHARILAKGTFNECEKYSNEFQTKIPDWLGLPRLEDNICEGIVLKPIIARYDEDGERIIFKSKNIKVII